MKQYSTFKECACNEPIVYLALRGGSSAETAIVALCNDRLRMSVVRVMVIERIAPKKVKAMGGTYIWRCPDELVPEANE